MIKNKQLYMGNNIKLLKNYTKCIESEKIMSEEEKETVELLDKYFKEHILFNIRQSENLEKNIKIVFNLLEKQGTRIQELENKIQKIKDYVNNL